MIKHTLKEKPSLKYGLLFASIMLAAPVSGFAATTTTPPPPPDYNKPVCEGIAEDDGDACLEKLKTFCALPENEPYKDCKEWKIIQEEVKNSDNADPNTPAEIPSGGVGGIIGAVGVVSQVLMFSPSSFAA